MGTSVDDLYDRIRKSQKEQEDQNQQQRIKVANEVAPDYDRAARIFAVEANTDLPYDVVDADLDNLEGLVKRKEFDASQYTDEVNGAPVFNAFAAEHPYHVAVLERDRKNLTRIERALNPIFLGWDAGWAMTEIAEIRDRQMSDFANPDNEKDKARLDELGKFMDGGNFGADSWYENMWVETGRQGAIMGWLTKESIGEVALGASIGAARGGFVGGLPGAVTGAGVGALWGGRGGFTDAAFRMERGLAYDEYLELGLNEEDARWAATAVGGANAALELLGFGALTKRIPGFDKILNDRIGGMINSVLSKPTMKHAIARATLKYGEGMATEILTEIMQESTLIVGKEVLKGRAVDRGDIRPETTAPVDFWSQVGDIAAQTMYGTMLIGGMGPGANLYRDSRNAYDAKRLGAVWDAMGEATEASETRQKAPTKFKEFVDKLGGDDKTITIKASRFTEYFQEQGMDAEEVAISVGITVEDLQSAQVGGWDIEIPAGQYLTKIAPSPHHAGLRNDLRAGSDKMSINEAISHDKNIKKTLEEIQALAAKEDPEQAKIDAEHIEKIKTRLVETGTSPEAAEHQATLMVGIPNLARRANLDPETFIRERFGGIVSTTNRQMRADRESFDPGVDPYLDRIRADDFPVQRDIFGPSLIDNLKSRGGLANDPELANRDIRLSVRGLIRDAGDTLDGAAEIAAEQGYIASADPDLLLEALEREADGELVFGNQFKIREGQRELLAKLEELAEILDRNGIDITSMTNEEVRAAINKLDTFYQSDDKLDTTQINELTKLLFSTAELDPAMLARAAAMLPAISSEQDFGDVKFTDIKTLDGKNKQSVLHTRTANKEFEMAKRRKDVSKMLKDCLGG